MKEKKENVVIDDFDFSLIADFFKRVDRQGPGGDWETRLAVSMIPDFRRRIRVADIGCGKGSQTFVLAEEYDAEIDAVDLLPEMLDGIRKKSQMRGLTDCVHPPFRLRHHGAGDRLFEDDQRVAFLHTDQGFRRCLFPLHERIDIQ